MLARSNCKDEEDDLDSLDALEALECEQMDAYECSIPLNIGCAAAAPQSYNAND